MAAAVDANGFQLAVELAVELALALGARSRVMVKKRRHRVVAVAVVANGIQLAVEQAVESAVALGTRPPVVGVMVKKIRLFAKLGLRRS